MGVYNKGSCMDIEGVHLGHFRAVESLGPPKAWGGGVAPRSYDPPPGNYQIPIPIQDSRR